MVHCFKSNQVALLYYIKRIMKTLVSIGFLFLMSLSMFAQDQTPNIQTEKKSRFRLIGDNRRTFVERQSASIFGLRLGYRLNDKFESGIGVYSSNLFGLLGNSVDKVYIDNSSAIPEAFSSEIGFHYASIFGEYAFYKNQRFLFTVNTQLGVGWVDIDFVEPDEQKDDLMEFKILIEHSVKVEIKTFDWLVISPGVGYRYLLFGEDQLQEAFNAPIFIIGASINFKRLFNKDK